MRKYPNESKPFAKCSTAVSQLTGEKWPLRWRVAIDDGQPALLVLDDDIHDFHFASRRDAELAARALIAAGLDTPEKLSDAGWPKIKQVMCEALPW